MDDVFVLKHADDFRYRRDFPDVGKKLIAEPLPFGCALHEPRNVRKLHDCGNSLARLTQLRELSKSGVIHGNNAHRRVNGAKRIILRGNGLFCKRVK